MESPLAIQPRRLFAWFQVVVVYVFLECALWSSSMTLRNRWALITAFTVVAFVLLDRPSIERLGFGFPTIGTRILLPLSFGAAIFLILPALSAGGPITPSRTLPFLYGAGGYLIWALVQEFLLQSFFFTRCEELFGSSTAVWAAATLFAAAHLPSLILTTFTLAGGLFFCEIFRRYRSIYPIAIIHAALGLNLGATLPDNLLHHMRTGIGYLTY